MSLDTIDLPLSGAAGASAIARHPDDLLRSTQDLLRDQICRRHPGRIALVSSFGAESVVSLHLVAEVDRATPVIFLDTGKLFPETLAYRDMLIERLGLASVRSVRPAPAISQIDPAGNMWDTDSDRCCWHRKVEPLDEALYGFAAWITGRKRFHGGLRTGLPTIEEEPDGRTKINPLAGWGAEDVARYMAIHDLPRHPLVDKGYRSIGCAPCTNVTAPGQGTRSGRWAGRHKTECGIHLTRTRSSRKETSKTSVQPGVAAAKSSKL